MRHSGTESILRSVKGYLNLADLSHLGLQVVVVLLATYCRFHTLCAREKSLLDVLLQKMLWDSTGMSSDIMLHVVRLCELAEPNGLQRKHVFYAMYHVQHHLSGPLNSDALVAVYSYWSLLFRTRPPLLSRVGAKDSFWSSKNVAGFLTQFKKQATMEQYKLSTVSPDVAYQRLYTISGDLGWYVEKWLKESWHAWCKSFSVQDYCNQYLQAVVGDSLSPLAVSEVEDLIRVYTDWIDHVTL